MASNEDSDDMYDWAKLETVTTFEWDDEYSRGNSQKMNQSSEKPTKMDSSTKLVDNTPTFKENFIESLATKPTAPISLLIESLVQLLCSMIKPDQATSHQIYQTICRELYKMHLIDETYVLGEFDVMRSQYQQALYQLATVACGEADIPLNTQSVWPLNNSESLTLSRYSRDFVEIGFIANGGFGSVYRARNKLDGIEYAVKKVNIKYLTKNRVMSHLDEVKTFASLNHSNIVPYKAAWLEPSFGTGINRPNAIDNPKTKTTSTQKVQKPFLNVRNNEFDNAVTFLETESEMKFGDVTNEDDDDQDTDSESDSSDSDVPSNHQNTAKNMSHLKLPTNHYNEDSSDFIQFKKNTLDDDDDDDDDEDEDEDNVDGANVSRAESVKEESDRKKKALIKKDIKVPAGVAEDVLNNDFGTNESYSLKLKWATLYIQMAFRPLTLRRWLDNRNKNDNFDDFYRKFLLKSVEDLDRSVVEIQEIPSTSAFTPINNRIVRRRASSISSELEKKLTTQFNIFDVAINIFIQALNGLRYIHMHNIVHHDIKPSNIFIGCEKNGDLYVQLGDFGLACPLDSKHSKESMIGTPTYAAPEQLEGHCDTKSDVFSLGLILLELLIPFKTYMERSETFEAARKGITPEHLPPNYAELVKELLQNYKKRPDTTQTFEYLKKMNLLNDDILFSGKSQNNSFDESSESVETPRNGSPICSTESTLNAKTGFIQYITSIACKNPTESTSFTSTSMTSSRNSQAEYENNNDRDPLKAKLERKRTERLRKEMEVNELDHEIKKIEEEINQRENNHLHS